MPKVNAKIPGLGGLTAATVVVSLQPVVQKRAFRTEGIKFCCSSRGLGKSTHERMSYRVPKPGRNI